MYLHGIWTSGCWIVPRLKRIHWTSVALSGMGSTIDILFTLSFTKKRLHCKLFLIVRQAPKRSVDLIKVKSNEPITFNDAKINFYSGFCHWNKNHVTY